LPTVFAHACRLGAEGIVSKKVDGTYRSGLSRVWIKVRNSAGADGRPDWSTCAAGAPSGKTGNRVIYLS
jgi:ATP-dependent DNA ligase